MIHWCDDLILMWWSDVERQNEGSRTADDSNLIMAIIRTVLSYQRYNKVERIKPSLCMIGLNPNLNWPVDKNEKRHPKNHTTPSETASFWGCHLIKIPVVRSCFLLSVSSLRSHSKVWNEKPGCFENVESLAREFFCSSYVDHADFRNCQK